MKDDPRDKVTGIRTKECECNSLRSETDTVVATLVEEGIMQQCDVIEECKLYQKHQHTVDELWNRLVSKYCKGPCHVSCNIRTAICRNA